MKLVDFFTDACCKGTELIECWYWLEDSAGDTIVDHDGYELRRPGGRSPKTFAMAVARLQRTA